MFVDFSQRNPVVCAHRYQAMKAMFSVEQDGSVADDIAVESQGLLGEFVDFVKVRLVFLFFY